MPYTKQHEDWQEGVEGGTPIRATVLEAIESALADLYKNNAVHFNMAGELEVKTGTGKFTAPWPGTLTGVWGTVGAAPTGAAVIIDVNKNTTTMFTTQANRPEIAAGETKVDDWAVPDVTAFTTGDEITVDIDQIGSGDPGQDLVVTLRIDR